MNWVEYACISSKGRIRSRNQDNYSCLGQYLPIDNQGTAAPLCGKRSIKKELLFGVFDGMGGEQRGEAASFIAASTASEWQAVSESAALQRLMLRINQKICDYTLENHLRTCGTTAAMLLFGPQEVYICDIGDSRIYRFRDQGCLQLSEDHVLPAYGNEKSPLLQFLGIPEAEMPIEPHILKDTVQPGDIYLICSDGLTDMVREDRLRQIIADDPVPKRAAGRLLDAAMAAGGKDNITMILIRCMPERGPGQEKQRPWPFSMFFHR